MNYLENSWYVVKFKYGWIVKWADRTQLAKKAITKKESVERSGILDKIYSLAEHYTPLCSLGTDLIKFTPGQKFPFTKILSPIHSFAGCNIPASQMAPLFIHLPTINPSEALTRTNSLTLIYLYDNIDMGNLLPVPGIITSFMLLSSDIISLEWGESQVNTTSQWSMTLPWKIFRNEVPDLESVLLSNQNHLSPLHSLPLWRPSLYSVNDPGKLLRHASAVSSIADTEEVRLDWIFSHKELGVNSNSFNNSPPTVMEDPLNLANSSVNSLITQISDEIMRSHLVINGILLGYPWCPTLNDPSEPYRGEGVVLKEFFHDVMN